MCYLTSVLEPDSDPYIFGPPGSGSIVRYKDRDPSINEQKNEETT